MGGSDKKNLRRGGREQRKRIGQGEGVRRAEDGSGVGRVGLSVVCRVSSGVVRWVRLCVVTRWREETAGDCTVDALGRLEEEIR